MQTFQGRTAFLTGAASGIGRCLAIQLAQAGCDLCLVDVNAEGLKRLAAELEPSGVRTLVYPCDLTDRKAVSATIASRSGTG
jgi:short-subunit dehydrogenase